MSQQYEHAAISRRLRDELIRGCRVRLPYEACGVIYGRSQGGGLYAAGCAFLRNVSPDPERSFCFDPDEWIRVCYEAQKNQRSIVGFFHSHPQGPSIPSPQDSEGWDGSSATLWIVHSGRQPEELRVYARNAAALPSEWQAVPLFVPAD